MDSAASTEAARGWRLALQGTERHTFRRHFAFTVLDSAAAGILANVLFIALKGMASQVWYLNIPLALSCVGMIAALHLGAVMADRPKKPFVVVPGLLYALASLLMALTTTSWLFLLISGLGAVFETAARPGVAAVVRSNYQARHRNHVMGRLRQAAALTFLAFNLLSAWLLDCAGNDPLSMIRGQMIMAGLLSLAAYLCFQMITVQETVVPPAERKPPATIRSAIAVLRLDRGFRIYVGSFFIFAFFNLLYATSVTSAVFDKDLKFSYLQCTLFMQTIPSLASFFFTGRQGAWLDRVGPWMGWAVIRAGWGLDPLLLALAVSLPSAGILPVVLLARLARGSVMGGSWILSWQTGVGYFAPLGGDTARYMGVQVFFNGLTRLAAAVASSCLLVSVSRSSVLLIGGVGVLLSAGHAWYCARREPDTQAQFPEERRTLGAAPEALRVPATNG